MGVVLKLALGRIGGINKRVAAQRVVAAATTASTALHGRRGNAASDSKNHHRLPVFFASLAHTHKHDADHCREGQG